MGGHLLKALPLLGLTVLILASSFPVSSETGQDNTHHVGVNLLEFVADDSEQWDEDKSPPDIALESVFRRPLMSTVKTSLLRRTVGLSNHRPML